MKLIKVVSRVALGIIAALFGLWLAVGVLAYYKPTILGSVVVRYLENDGPIFEPNRISKDWEAWFTKQQSNGWKVADSPLMTPWGEKLNPDSVLQEYPRPHLRRAHWLNLNGLWSFNVVEKEISHVDTFPGKILVPFAIEAPLSGVGRPLLAGERLWYQRTFEIPQSWDKYKKILLHFSAVDWDTTVYVNGKEIGRHQGGYTPFSFDIAAALKHKGPNELVVAVWDPTNANGATQSRGKQHLEPKSIFYTATSGIWQTVWVEPVSERAIESIATTVDITAGSASLQFATQEQTDGLTVHVALENEATTISGTISEPLIVKPGSPKLWSPNSPHLYYYTATLKDEEKVVDTVRGYFALRSVGRTVHNNEPLFTLNEKPIFHLGVLDQGYWPDGGMTAPSDEALLYDLKLMKSYGLNTIRKHVKVESARFYYHADRIGLMVWQDMPNGGNRFWPAELAVPIFRYIAPFGVSDTALKITDNKYESWGRDSASRNSFQAELAAMIDALASFPSVVMWVPFNEYWGQFDAAKTAAWVAQLDASRLVNHASGWMDQGAGDVYDDHVYANYNRWEHRDPLGERVSVLGEFGGKTLSVEGHVWDDEVVGYGVTSSKNELFDAYGELFTDEILPRVRLGLSATIYTQLSDVESEVNGYVTYDRRREKFDQKSILGIHSKLYEEFERIYKPR